jgi:hypothetical protein
VEDDGAGVWQRVGFAGLASIQGKEDAGILRFGAERDGDRSADETAGRAEFDGGGLRRFPRSGIGGAGGRLAQEPPDALGIPTIAVPRVLRRVSRIEAIANRARGIDQGEVAALRRQGDPGVHPRGADRGRAAAGEHH